VRATARGIGGGAAEKGWYIFGWRALFALHWYDYEVMLYWTEFRLDSTASEGADC
jgi:hypothetical protein